MAAQGSVLSLNLIPVAADVGGMVSVLWIGTNLLRKRAGGAEGACADARTARVRPERGDA